MPYSHHSHSGQFCRHAYGTLEAVVLEAIRQKFAVYALTEHVPRYRKQDLYPEEADMSPEDLEAQFEAFLIEAHRLKALYAPQITLLVGAETEHITAIDLDNLETLLERHRERIEFLVGSVHHVNEVPIDFDEKTLSGLLDTFTTSLSRPDEVTQREKLMSLYFDAQYEVLRRFRPEVIGHFDLCRLYFPAVEFGAYPAAMSKIERNIRLAVDYGALFEINAAGFRKGWRTACPGADVIQLIIQLGGRFTISDDSHGPHTVGWNYDHLYKYLRATGLQDMWYLREVTGSDESGRRLIPARVEGNWWDDNFWSDKKDPKKLWNRDAPSPRV